MPLPTELARYGPAAEYAVPSVAEASEYCRELATRHYENFTVASWLLPRHLRRHFCHVYAYCRWADDLADESGTPEECLALLNGWEGELDACYTGQTRHPVFVALAETIREFQIPREPFADLLVAFRQDQAVREYDTFEQLLGYCRNSANPVGRLVLYLGRCHDAERAALSDSICTGLQLANFWQDVRRDHEMGRVYLPRADRNQFHYADKDLAQRRFNRAFEELLRFEVDRAEGYLREGVPLVDLVPRALRIDVQLFLRGGFAILAAIRRAEYNVWRRRPTLTRWTKARLVVDSLLGRRI
jgi:squalene synthase HpnC